MGTAGTSWAAFGAINSNYINDYKLSFTSFTKAKKYILRSACTYFPETNARLYVTPVNIYDLQPFISWPRVHKAFQNQDQDPTKVKNSFTMHFL